MRKNQQLASDIVLSVLSGESLTARFSALWRAHPDLAGADRGTIQDLSYGTLRYLTELQAYAAFMTSKPIADERVNALLWVSLYQLIHTRNAPHAVVNEAVNAAQETGRPWAKALVNALLRRFLREQKTLKARIPWPEEAFYSYPSWWIQRLKRDHPQDYAQILAEGNRHPPMTLRVNRRKHTQESYLEKLTELGIAATPAGSVGLVLTQPVAVERLPGFAQGWTSVQDYGAQLVPALLDLKEGMRICDACCAPGGKTAHLLEAAAVHVTALDASAERLVRVRENLGRLGLDASLKVADAADLSAWWDGEPYDAVLLDAPCSASGVVRRHPDSKWLRRDQDVAQYAREQNRLLEALWRVVKPGGKLLYVTCSVFNAENEEVIVPFCERTHDAHLAPGSFPLDTAGRWIPSAHNDGFFYALLHKA
ncbi:MAG: 16S rRNA (cytosine(967)-C(5))-methyltransferase RsmB [Burkholderiales bacterium]